VRKQSVHTGFGLRRIKGQRGLSVLLQHGVIVIDYDRTISISMGRGSEPENGKVQAVSQGSRPEHGKNRSDEDSP